MFPAQIALVDAAARAVARRDEDAAENPLAAERLRLGRLGPRIFGSEPGTYGAGPEALLASGAWQTRDELGRAYLEAPRMPMAARKARGGRPRRSSPDASPTAALLVHAGDDPGRDLLEGSADVAFVGGFAAAVAALGGKADVVALDTTDPARPRARSLAEAVARVVRARAVNPRFIDGQLRHGPRGAAEFAETVDRLIGFAETTEAVPSALIEAVHDAYLGDPRVRAFLLERTPPRCAPSPSASRRRAGAACGMPRRNAVDDELAALIAEAREREAA